MRYFMLVFMSLSATAHAQQCESAVFRDWDKCVYGYSVEIHVPSTDAESIVQAMDIISSQPVLQNVFSIVQVRGVGTKIKFTLTPSQELDPTMDIVK